jgi:hypothetical protein
MASVVGSCEIKKASCNRYCENLLRKIGYKNLGKGEKKEKKRRRIGDWIHKRASSLFSSPATLDGSSHWDNDTKFNLVAAITSLMWQLSSYASARILASELHA